MITSAVTGAIFFFKCKSNCWSGYCFWARAGRSDQKLPWEFSSNSCCRERERWGKGKAKPAVAVTALYFLCQIDGSRALYTMEQLHPGMGMGGNDTSSWLISTAALKDLSFGIKWGRKLLLIVQAHRGWRRVWDAIKYWISGVVPGGKT